MVMTANEIVEVLYRGVLGRYPDEEGRSHHLARLERDPEALLAMLCDFTESPEAEQRRLRERNLGPLVAARNSSFGPVNHVISLGTHCYSSALIKTLGLKRRSYPFDWLFSSPELVLDCLSDGFERFLDRRYFRTSTIEERAEPHVNVADHAFYADTMGVRFVFNHRDPNDPQHHAYYKRAVDRFLNVLKSDDVKLLLMVDSTRGIDPETFSALSRELNRLGRNIVLDAVEVLPEPSGEVARMGFAPVVTTGDHRLVRFASTSPIEALAFVNPLDDAIMRNLIAQYAIELLD